MLKVNLSCDICQGEVEVKVKLWLRWSYGKGDIMVQVMLWFW